MPYYARAVSPAPEAIPPQRRRAFAAVALANAGRGQEAATLCADLAREDLAGLATDEPSLAACIQALLAAGRLEQPARLLRAVTGAPIKLLRGETSGCLLATAPCPQTGTMLAVLGGAALMPSGAGPAAARLLASLPG